MNDVNESQSTDSDIYCAITRTIHPDLGSLAQKTVQKLKNTKNKINNRLTAFKGLTIN